MHTGALHSARANGLGKQKGLRAVALTGLLLVLALAVPASALAAANAIVTPTGYDANAITRGDDTNNLVVNMPFNMNWLGTNYNQVYINMNGNVTFVDPYCDSTYSQTYQAHHLNTTQYYNTPNPYLPMIAPFFADVDTANTTGGQATYSSIATGTIPQYQGHNCFIVNWINVMSYMSQTHPVSPNTNSFQLLLVDRSDTGAGNFDIIFNYNTINWDVGATGGSGAVAGWSTAGGTNGWTELSGSLAPSGTHSLLDSSSSSTSLIQNSLNSGGVLGRYVWSVRNGSVANSTPSITAPSHVFEGNVANGYLGYTGLGDVYANDVDGAVASLRGAFPGLLPVGTTSVSWVATDDASGVTTQTQSLVVTDTTPPSTPSLSSPSNPIAVWSANNVVSVNGTGVADICTGLRGFSYVWSQNATAAPDTALDACATSTVTVPATSTATVLTGATCVDYQPFATSTWPAAWTKTTYVQLSNTSGHMRGTYAAEVYATNATRRTGSFYRDYDLSTYASATVTFWDQAVGTLSGDYDRVEYSTDGGATWTQPQNITAATAWTQRSYNLPVGGTVRVRFSASVAAATDYVDWENIAVTGYTTSTSVVSVPTATTSLGTTNTVSDGTWYFNIRSVDQAGNWSVTRSIGPFYIDTVKPTTTCSAPSTWASATVSASLTATDPSGPVANTWYKLDAGAVTTYTATVPVTGDGTHTLLFWSKDAAGNAETTKTATIRIDTAKPSTPTSITASAVATKSIEVNWVASTDSGSGVAYYGVYRGGSLVATTAATTYTDTGLNAGSTYTYYVIAFDAAGNASSQSGTASATTPAAAIWISMSTDTVDMGNDSPGTPSTVSSATTVKVGGVGVGAYDFYCSATDWSNAATASVTPTMPVSTLSYATNGWASAGVQPFTNAAYKLDTSAGSKYVWEHDYRFDYVFNVPWAYAPGTYTTTVTYTVVSH